MKKVLSVILSALMVLSLTTTVFAEKKIIRVGVNGEFPPFEYYDNGKLTGFDIELMNCIGERIGYDIEYVEFPFDRLFPAVASGEVDCAISAISVTKERDGVVDFTTPYLVYREYADTQQEINVEEYAIVFRSGLSDAVYSGVAKSKEEKLFRMFEVTIGNMIHDDTIYNLIEKYNLNKVNDLSGINYEYVTATTYVTDTDKAQHTDASQEPSEWAKKEINSAGVAGIIDRNKKYLYKENITREEFCELVYNTIKAALKKTYTIKTSFKFEDTDNETVVILNRVGIINGKSETKFAPDDFLTREEAATIINRMIEKVFPSMISTQLYFEFEDSENISDWAMDSIQSICNFKFMNGVGNGKFAPKDTYTTEQAIVTLARVFESAQETGAAEESSNVGIIGGADGPTSIIVGENVNVIEKDKYSDFRVNASKNLTKVDDFYIDEAIKLIVESGKLAADKEFITYYTTEEEMVSSISEIGAADYSKPSAVYYMEADKEKILTNLKTMYGEYAEGLDFEKLLKLNKVTFAVLPNMINASYGANNLAALTILNNSKGYIMPKSFKNNFALYFEYDKGCCALVAFSKYGEGVISGNMSFVINADKDNIFRRIYEITQGIGEDSIKISKVK